MVGLGIFRRLVTSLLVMSVLVTSGTMVIARHTPEIGTLLVICSGHGYATILVNDDGEPVERKMACPDCVLSFPDFAAQPTILPAIRRNVWALEVTVPAHPVLAQQYSKLLARGPPAQV